MAENGQLPFPPLPKPPQFQHNIPQSTPAHPPPLLQPQPQPQNLGPPPEYRVENESLITSAGASAITTDVPVSVAIPPPPPPPPEGAEPELPPTYQVAAALPTYEEAELAKAGKLDGSSPDAMNNNNHLGGIRGGGGGGGGGNGFAFFALPSMDDDTPSLDNMDEPDITLLGNDFVFFTAFLTAFLFNWIGFLLLMCFCHTIAARYGALSGFGLSLTKWTLIVKNSTDLVSAENSWLWWLIMAFGMLICMRAICQYLHIKKSWTYLSSSARERLFFFY